MTITPEEFLVKNGNICPACGLSGEQKNTVALDTTDGTVFLGRVFIHVGCGHCGATWQARFDLAGWTYLRTGKENAKSSETPVKWASEIHSYSHPGPVQLKATSDDAQPYIESGVLRSSWDGVRTGDDLGSLPEF
jgi:hypothetical protein